MSKNSFQTKNYKIKLLHAFNVPKRILGDTPGLVHENKIVGAEHGDYSFVLFPCMFGAHAFVSVPFDFQMVFSRILGNIFSTILGRTDVSTTDLILFHLYFIKNVVLVRNHIHSWKIYEWSQGTWIRGGRGEVDGRASG